MHGETDKAGRPHTVAHGDIWSLTDHDLIRQQVNRESYCTPLAVMFDKNNQAHNDLADQTSSSKFWGPEEKPELPDRLFWAVKKVCRIIGAYCTTNKD